MAERTGLEPATPGVTGRYSNQLNYRSDLGWPLEVGRRYGRPSEPAAKCHGCRTPSKRGANRN